MLYLGMHVHMYVWLRMYMHTIDMRTITISEKEAKNSENRQGYMEQFEGRKVKELAKKMEIQEIILVR